MASGSSVINRTTLYRNTPQYSKCIANRPQEIKPVGAWVQPNTRDINGVGAGFESFKTALIGAYESAQIEENKIKEKSARKTAKLKQFQNDVKKRVQAIENAKKENLLKNTIQIIKAQQNVFHQTAFASEVATPRKDRCLVRNEENLKIKQLNNADTDAKVQKPAENRKSLVENKNMVHNYTTLAKKNLLSRTALTERYKENLPGGHWKSDSSSNPNGDSLNLNNSCLDPGNTDDSKFLKNINSAPIRVTYNDKNEFISPVICTDNNSSRPQTLVVLNKDLKDKEEHQKQISVQRALYRRLFMDMEREQVKEKLNAKEHQNRIKKLKHQKEVARSSQERDWMPVVTNPLTGCTDEESWLKQQIKHEKLAREQTERRKQVQKARDSARFIEALKHNLRERIEMKQLDLPSLCSCGETIWDTNPQTCANNCIFYKNSKGYEKALQSLLRSCDAM